jgi:flagellar motility protein MotE (MotC chaperone)
MKSAIPRPRLLPLTIGMLGVVLVAKTAALVRSTFVHGQPAAMIAPARASGPETSAAKPAKPAETKPAEAAKPEAALDTAPPISESERSVLLDLRARRQELEAREATLAARESMLAAAETKLSARIDELQSLQKKLESLDASHRQQEDSAWQGLVKVYETMKPRDAATIFNDLGMQVLLAVVSRMKEAKAAAILAAMVPDKARDVTTQLAMIRTRAANVLENGDQPAPPREPTKPPRSGT